MKLLSIFFVLITFHTMAAQDNVVVNKQRLSAQIVQEFQAYYGIAMQNGDYWYDKYSGAWGYTGGPAIGLLLPGMNLGGELQVNASNGNTSVFINGRELHLMDVLGLQQLIGPVLPGRYWLDGYGNAGYEGGPALVNLWQLAQNSQASQGSQGGSTFYRNSYTGIGAGSSGGTSYVMGKDWSVIVGN